MTGRIIAINCGIFSVLAEDNVYKVSARGLFKYKFKKLKVGDIVELDDETFVITMCHEKRNSLIRPSISNVDQLVIVHSLMEPEFSYLLIFKYLTYANMNNISPIIVLTKIDKFHDEEKIKEIKSVFSLLSIPLYIVSNKTKEGYENLETIFKDKLTCFIGQSGVGKSSLINTIDSSFKRTVGEYSDALGRGKHQTKEVILLPYKNGFIADTPGFSSLDLNLYKEDLAVYFPGFFNLYTKCYFSNCLHISENKCCVKDAVNEHKIPKIAYECYLKLVDESLYKNQRYFK